MAMERSPSQLGRLIGCKRPSRQRGWGRHDAATLLTLGGGRISVVANSVGEDLSAAAGVLRNQSGAALAARRGGGAMRRVCWLLSSPGAATESTRQLDGAADDLFPAIRTGGGEFARRSAATACSSTGSGGSGSTLVRLSMGSGSSTLL